MLHIHAFSKGLLGWYISKLNFETSLSNVFEGKILQRHNLTNFPFSKSCGLFLSECATQERFWYIFVL